MEAARRERAWRWALGLLIVAAVCAAFSPALNNAFVAWDDGVYILDNPWIRGLTPGHLRWMLTSARGGLWQPLTWLSLALDHSVWGLDPVGYHLTNILLHAGAALVFFAVCRRLLKNDAGAAAAALFFAVHPLRVESVAWAVERKDVLSGVFWLAAVYAHLRAAEAGSRRSAWSAAGAAAFALSLAAKVTGLMLPVALLILEIYPLRRLPADARLSLERGRRNVWFSLAPYFILSAVFGVAGLAVSRAAGALPAAGDRPLFWRVSAVLYGLLFYPAKTLWPSGLAAYYAPRPWFGRWSWEFAAAALAVAGAAAALWKASARRPALGAAFACFAATLFPLSGLVQHGMAFSACDRYSYLSCLGFAVLFGAAVAAAGRAGKALALAWLAALGLAAWRQCGVWKDTLTLWTSAASRAPGGFVLSSVGVALADAGRLDEALPALKKAVAKDPGVALSYSNLGVALDRAGDEAGAMEVWRRGLACKDIPDLRAAMGHALSRGTPAQAEEAVGLLRDAVARSPETADWRLYLAQAQARAGRPDQAEAEYAAALALDPDSGIAENNWGLLLAEQGRVEEALAHYRAALRLPGARAQANYNLGNLFLAEGLSENAERSFREALRLDPALSRAEVNLGNILARRGRLAEAAALYRSALKKTPGLREARGNLSAVEKLLRR